METTNAFSAPAFADAIGSLRAEFLTPEANRMNLDYSRS
jgi:hypothetical protein